VHWRILLSLLEVLEKRKLVYARNFRTIFAFQGLPKEKEEFSNALIDRYSFKKFKITNPPDNVEKNIVNPDGLAFFAKNVDNSELKVLSAGI
jgi:hypothetical protein